VEQAELAGRFRPSSSPPRRGVSLRVDKGAPVTAVSWGKVVHDDILRGFGRVIIILHGEDYYSLYAYLADSRVDVGQDVAMGDVLGTAGYHPELQAPGLYFELRFHQKAINPEGWLVARR
jgi:septal ring factor EnvC (AmiA/AmiB activator)